MFSALYIIGCKHYTDPILLNFTTVSLLTDLLNEMISWTALLMLNIYQINMRAQFGSRFSQQLQTCIYKNRSEQSNRFLLLISITPKQEKAFHFEFCN